MKYIETAPSSQELEQILTTYYGTVPKYTYVPSRLHARMKNKLLTTQRDPATANNPGRIELPELVPVKTSGVGLLVADPVAPTPNVVLQGAHEVSVVVTSTRVWVTDPDVAVEKMRLPLSAEPDWAKAQERMPNKAARAKKGDENFIVA
jgi:hypothetical protein